MAWTLCPFFFFFSFFFLSHGWCVPACLPHSLGLDTLSLPCHMASVSLFASALALALATLFINLAVWAKKYRTNQRHPLPAVLAASAAAACRPSTDRHTLTDRPLRSSPLRPDNTDSRKGLKGSQRLTSHILLLLCPAQPTRQSTQVVFRGFAVRRAGPSDTLDYARERRERLTVFAAGPHIHALGELPPAPRGEHVLSLHGRHPLDARRAARRAAGRSGAWPSFPARPHKVPCRC